MPMGSAYPNLKRFTNRDCLTDIIGDTDFGAVASKVIQNYNSHVFDQEANLEKFLSNVVMPAQDPFYSSIKLSRPNSN
jgi:hypothetical protein